MDIRIIVHNEIQLEIVINTILNSDFFNIKNKHYWIEEYFEKGKFDFNKLRRINAGSIHLIEVIGNNLYCQTGYRTVGMSFETFKKKYAKKCKKINLWN